jgi:hypothetical protein
MEDYIYSLFSNTGNLHLTLLTSNVTCVDFKLDYRVCGILYKGVSKFLDWPPGSRTANGTALSH